MAYGNTITGAQQQIEFLAKPQHYLKCARAFLRCAQERYKQDFDRHVRMG